MALTDMFIRKTVVSVIIILVVCAGGYLSYERLGRFEDPEFVVRIAKVIVPYPGAQPGEVEKEVTDLLESAVQEMQEVEKLTSVSEFGRAEITVEMNRAFAETKADLQQLWTKMRNKLRDVERNLPPGAGPVIVWDDFGDVFALFFAITGEGYSFAEIKDYAEDLRKELLMVPGVAKVAFLGTQDEAIFIEISRARAAQLGIPPDRIYQALQQQNAMSAAGKVRLGTDYVEISPVGNVDSVESIGNIVIAGAEGQQIFLRDVADVSRGYKDPPTCLMRYNGKPAVGLGIANITGGNVVATGDAVKKRLAELDALRPIGMELNVVSYQSDSVREAVDGFVNNLIAALVIVVVTLLIFMGLRSGLIIGAVLLLTVAATLIAMYMANIDMQRISLGALIIALGMLVDNAIVVTEGMLIRIQRGDEKFTVAREVVAQTIWPLLGGTIVGILAFSAIGFSPDNTGEYAGSLFWVICYSLFLSWVFAVTVTPFLCVHFLKPAKEMPAGGAYDNALFRGYRRLLAACVRWRWATAAVMVVMLVLAVYGFGRVPAGFFPDSTRPQFVLDYWLPQGTDISVTDKEIGEIEAWVTGLDGVTNVTSLVGQGALRFMLTYTGESPNSSYGQLLIDVEDWHQIPQLLQTVQAHVDQSYPDAQAKAWKFALGVGGGSKIEAEFHGPEPDVLRSLAEQAKDIMYEDGRALAIKDDWRRRVRVVRPVYSEARARNVGVSIEDLRNALLTTYSGRQVGVYREAENLIPIIARAPQVERAGIDDIEEVPVYSPTAQRSIPISQALAEVVTETANPIIRRENRIPTIVAQCDPIPGTMSSALQKSLQPKIEAIPLPPGYELVWSGEYGDSQKAQKGIASTLPFGLAAMVLTVFFLFNAVRQPLVIWLAVPLAIIGVTIGLLLFRAPFEFMAILGFLSLIGMLIKNAIVLVDQTDLEIREGKEPFLAVLDSAVSRVRPVSMGALTTVLGIIPLLLDPFFKSMAVTIIFGLTFATVLTLIVVPVIYAIFFRIKAAAHA